MVDSGGSPAAVAGADARGLEAGGAAYLRQVEELRCEIEGAMEAVSGNRLGVLEESLWRQQVLCTSLRHLSQTLGAEDAEGPLMERIREASTQLAEVNRTYAYLVQQSAGSAELLLRLCRSYRNEDATNAGDRRAWSYEA